MEMLGEPPPSLLAGFYYPPHCLDVEVFSLSLSLSFSLSKHPQKKKKKTLFLSLSSDYTRVPHVHRSLLVPPHPTLPF